MHRLVQDLLLLARPDSGRLRPRLLPLDLRAVLDRVVSAIPHPEFAVTLEVQVASLPVRADPDCMGRLFANLLENALRHTPGGGQITLSGWSESGQVVVQVADTGEGIPPEHLPHVFERFYRVDAARDRDHGGTGLGLSICQSVVDAHGGTISIESDFGKGTIVTVRLPADT